MKYIRTEVEPALLDLANTRKTVVKDVGVMTQVLCSLNKNVRKHLVVTTHPVNDNVTIVWDTDHDWGHQLDLLLTRAVNVIYKTNKNIQVDYVGKLNEEEDGWYNVNHVIRFHVDGVNYIERADIVLL